MADFRGSFYRIDGGGWYFNNNAYLQFNDIHAWVDRAPVGDNEANIDASRLAVDF